jgi:transposase
VVDDFTSENVALVADTSLTGARVAKDGLLNFPDVARQSKELKCNSPELFISKGKRYTEEFKNEAVKQITEQGYSVTRAAGRPGVCTKTLYQ